MSASADTKTRIRNAIDKGLVIALNLINALIKKSQMEPEAKVATKMFVKNFFEEIIRGNEAWIIAKITPYTQAKDSALDYGYGNMQRVLVDPEGQVSVKINFGNVETAVSMAVTFLVAYGHHILGSRKNARTMFRAMVSVSNLMKDLLTPDHMAYKYIAIIGRPAKEVLASYEKNPAMLKRNYQEQKQRHDSDSDSDSDSEPDAPEPAKPPKQPKSRLPKVSESLPEATASFPVGFTDEEYA
jgi:hypothetical protein